MLELRRLHYQPATANRPLLEGINLKAKAGEPILIAGASGSGKTSLIEVISGLASQSKGKIFFQNQNNQYLFL